MRIGTGTALALSAMVVAGQLVCGQESPGDPDADKARAIVEQMASRPDGAEWIVGQVCMVEVFGKVGDHFSAIEAARPMIKEKHVGSVLLLATNFDNTPAAGKPSTPEQVATICDRLQELALQSAEGAGLEPLRLFMAIDHEGDGKPWTRVRSGVTPIPSNAAIAATWDTGFCQLVGEVIGSELSLLGINMLLGPVLDINTDQAQDAMGERCFGGHPQWAARMSKAYIRGVHKGSRAEGQAVAVVAKHWPGHGDCDRVSDDQVAYIVGTVAELGQKELVPFLEATNPADEDACADGLMPAHSIYPDIQQDREESYPITLDTNEGADVIGTIVAAAQGMEDDGSLRQKLQRLADWRDSNLIVSDAVYVEGLEEEYKRQARIARTRTPARFDYEDAAERCLLAGHDLVILSGEKDSRSRQMEVIDHLASQYGKGLQPRARYKAKRFSERVRQAAERVVAAKLRLLHGPAGRTAAAATSLADRLKKLEGLVDDHIAALYPDPGEDESKWHKAVQWVFPGSGPAGRAPPLLASENVLTVEPSAFRTSVPGIRKGLLADILIDERDAVRGRGSVEMIDETQVKLLLRHRKPADLKETHSLREAEQLLPQADWIVILLGHTPRTTRELKGINSVQASRDLLTAIHYRYGSIAEVLRDDPPQRVAVIACQSPYHLTYTDIRTTDAYLITHTKLPRYLERAVEVLLHTGPKAGPVDSPMSITGAGYDVLTKHPIPEPDGPDGNDVVVQRPPTWPAWLIGGAVVVTLAALSFAGSAVLTNRRTRLMIEAAPAGQRAKLVEMTLDSYRIEHDNLTRAQKHDLVMKQIELRRDRLHTWAKLIGFVALLLAAVVVIIVICTSRTRAGQEAARPSGEVPTTIAGQAGDERATTESAEPGG